MKRNVIYTVETKNQMCNQLFWNASLMAAAIEYDFDICTYTFEFEKMFALNNSFNDELRFKISNNPEEAAKHIRRNQLIRRFLRRNRNPLIFDIGFDESGERLDKALKAGVFSKKKYVYGWPFYNPDSLEKNRERVAEFFRPNEEIQKKAEHFINSISDEFDFKIAMHIRRNDYKEYLEGKYYYENEVYKNAMKHMCKLLPNKKIVFVVFSDQPELIGEIESEEYSIILSQKSAVEDLAIMSKCDYIIAPPSSFSGWASFSGNKPLYRIIERDKPTFELDDFGVCWISKQYKSNLYKRLEDEK